MDEKLRELVRDLLKKGEVDAVLSLRAFEGCVAPHLFTSEEEVSDLVSSPKYPIGLVLPMLQAEYPEAKLGVVVRGCEERTFIELAKRGQIDLDKLVLIGLACTSEEADECKCDQPYPTKIDIGEKVEGVPNPEIDRLSKMEMEERLGYWADQFAKCIKCYGCKNACPLCICESCILEEKEWVKTGGNIPPEFPTFHLIRAYHTADRCVDCKECERACPAHIPLTTLYGMIRKDMQELFGYRAGEDVKKKPPLVTVLEDSALEEA